jgi:hypothetical protein
MSAVIRKPKAAKQPRRRAAPPRPEVSRTEEAPPAEEVEASSPRTRGDSYSEDVAREDELVGESSSHLPQVNRRPEEPSEPELGAGERLEGST